MIGCLVFSLVECLLIMPAHLSHRDLTAKPSRRWWLVRLQDAVTATLRRIIRRFYQPILTFCLRWRYATFASFAAMIILTIGLMVSGIVKFVSFPSIAADYVIAKVALPEGSSAGETQVALDRITDGLRQLQAQYPVEQYGEVFGDDTITLGAQPSGRRGPGGGSSSDGSHLGEVAVYVNDLDLIGLDGLQLAEQWREAIGPLAGIDTLEFDADLSGRSEKIELQLTAIDFATLDQARMDLSQQLLKLDGVLSVSDSMSGAKRELSFRLNRQGAALGLTANDLARQIRHHYYGSEAQRIQRQRDEIKVMVRYPEQQRDSYASLDQLRIRDQQGNSYPLSEIAEWDWGLGFTSIQRVDQHRVVTITGELDTASVDPTVINDTLYDTIIPALKSRHHGLDFLLTGNERDDQRSNSELGIGFLVAILAMFGLMAVAFSSYVQPLIVMTAIPFGLIGAVGGHLLLGLPVSLLSIFGMVALAGVVVNDSLVLVDAVNVLRQRYPLAQAVMRAARQRFRAIVLTTLTTFLGLTPLMLETSIQAQFLIPMATSLAFGVLFATTITLILVPCLYLVLADIRQAFLWLLGRNFNEEHRDHPEADLHIPQATPTITEPRMIPR